ncbi:hypothetical protein [Nitriliruptor alkaliphilus]|uniref:hypothetical protein n=1 Tax=Nitriliruptor alkaliphilus TaxID=427918 RepID=UPI00069670CB|nr:hypothetical protein [Nitriliruptor alkaliphilus]
MRLTFSEPEVEHGGTTSRWSLVTASEPNLEPLATLLNGLTSTSYLATARRTVASFLDADADRPDTVATETHALEFAVGWDHAALLSDFPDDEATFDRVDLPLGTLASALAGWASHLESPSPRPERSLDLPPLHRRTDPHHHLLWLVEVDDRLVLRTEPDLEPLAVFVDLAAVTARDADRWARWAADGEAGDTLAAGDVTARLAMEHVVIESQAGRTRLPRTNIQRLAATWAAALRHPAEREVLLHLDERDPTTAPGPTTLHAPRRAGPDHGPFDPAHWRDLASDLRAEHDRDLWSRTTGTSSAKLADATEAATAIARALEDDEVVLARSIARQLGDHTARAWTHDAALTRRVRWYAGQLALARP